MRAGTAEDDDRHAKQLDVSHGAATLPFSERDALAGGAAVGKRVLALKITYKKSYKGIFAPSIDTGRLIAVSSVAPQRLALRRWEDVGACDAGEMVG